MGFELRFLIFNFECFYIIFKEHTNWKRGRGKIHAKSDKKSSWKQEKSCQRRREINLKCMEKWSILMQERGGGTSTKNGEWWECEPKMIDNPWSSICDEFQSVTAGFNFTYFAYSGMTMRCVAHYPAVDKCKIRRLLLGPYETVRLEINIYCHHQ